MRITVSQSYYKRIRIIKNTCNMKNEIEIRKKEKEHSRFT